MKTEHKNYVSAWFDDRPMAVQLKEKDKEKNQALLNYHKSRFFTVGDLIEKLKAFNLNLPVCISDWNEEYALDNNDVSSYVKECNAFFYSHSDKCNGRYISIGGNHET